MSEAVLKKISHPYITRKKGVCGGKPIIAGTRIRVQDIIIEYNQMELTPDKIVQAHPHLTLAQVHDALSYYYNYAEEILSDIRKSEQLVGEMRKKYSKSVRLRLCNLYKKQED